MVYHIIMDALIQFPGAWHYAAAILTVLLSLLASGHAVLYKRDSRAAVLWVGFIWFVPLAGAVLYFSFGVNRIRRQAASLRGAPIRHADISPTPAPPPTASPGAIPLLPLPSHLAPLVQLGNTVAQRPLLPGNRVEFLFNGDESFPAMLQAIAAAQSTITLSTYIFDNDSTGQAFAAALNEASLRGVDVRVIIDDAGARYSWPTIIPRLRRGKIRVARFLPTFSLFRAMSINLRTHRKILVIDGRAGFTGGINIRAGNLLSNNPIRAIQDLHFRLSGPIVAQLQHVFAEDWRFCHGETLTGDRWFPPLTEEGNVLARGISDGPDEDFEILRLILFGALSCAKHKVQIVTPYFLPDQSLISALNVAALRGVQVDIFLPSKNNLPIVQWASRAHWWQVLQRGCRIWLTPPPFDHSKLMLVDGSWALFGSANWDPRSLRLNFELNIETYDPALAQELEAIVAEKQRQAARVTLQDVDNRAFPAKLRDGVARLFTPYL